MFYLTLENVLLCLLYIIPGYVVCKMKKASVSHLKTLSAVLIYGCSPCMIANAFLKLEFTPQGLLNLSVFFVAVTLIQIAFMLGLYFIFKKKFENGKYRVITVGSALGNLGYFGLPVIEALFPSQPEVLGYASVYVVSMNIILFTLGVYLLTKRKDLITVKSAFINPATIGLVAGLFFYISGLNLSLPSDNIAFTAIGLLGKTTLPLSMIILGIRLATMKIKDIFTNKPAYVLSLGKLIIFPLFAYLLVVFLPLAETVKATVLVLSATPCAASVMTMAELYGNEEETSANAVMMSTLLSFITIPILTLLL